MTWPRTSFLLPFWLPYDCQEGRPREMVEQVKAFAAQAWHQLDPWWKKRTDFPESYSALQSWAMGMCLPACTHHIYRILCKGFWSPWMTDLSPLSAEHPSNKWFLSPTPSGLCFPSPPHSLVRLSQADFMVPKHHICCSARATRALNHWATSLSPLVVSLCSPWVSVKITSLHSLMCL